MYIKKENFVVFFFKFISVQTRDLIVTKLFYGCIARLIVFCCFDWCKLGEEEDCIQFHWIRRLHV